MGQGIYWHSSFDLDELACRLSNHIKENCNNKDIFQKETILVQSQGMQRFLSLRLARHLNVAFNIEYIFPRQLINRIFEGLFPGFCLTDDKDKLKQTFSIMHALPLLLEDKKFSPVKNYLTTGRNDGAADELKLFQISEKIADLFDQYQLFRPQMINAWERGELFVKGDQDEAWQSVLWNCINTDGSTGQRNEHFASLLEKFYAGLKRGSLSISALPETITIFGISYLPFEFLRILNALSEYTEINIFQMNPCREYWGDIVEFRKKYSSMEGFSLDDNHYEEGNRLLSSLGKASRDWINFLIEEDIIHHDCDEHFEEKLAPASLLHSIQRDILTLSGTDPDNVQIPERIIDENDESVVFHSCHSSLRELQVLKDNLLDMLQNDSSLMPEDILVMIPEIEKYAPYIEAVFDQEVELSDSAENENQASEAKASDEAILRGIKRKRTVKIPYSIADKTMRADSGAADLVFSILKLRNERFRVSSVLNILESPVLCRDIAFSEEEVSQIKDWIRDTNIRWGYDSEQKRQLELTADDCNTWMAAADRMLLGYAMNKDEFHGGILAYPEIDTSDAAVLGRFIQAVKLLKSKTDELKNRRSMAEWQEYFDSLIKNLIYENNDTLEQLTFIHSSLGLAAETEGENSSNNYGIEVIEAFLKERMDNEVNQHGFLRGGVTFCGMLPMRSIPFKVICLLGMNHSAFPRQQGSLNFDLISKYFRAGDRSRRHDDRYLFLETLMSAREKLYISYLGQSLKDNSDLPPSTLISELLDYICDNFSLPDNNGKESINKRFITRHRLQPFSPHYFLKKERFFSYSEHDRRLAESCRKCKSDCGAFMDVTIPLPEESNKFRFTADKKLIIELDELVSFFQNPSKYFLNNRLGIYPDKWDIQLQDNEIFGLDNLESYSICDDMLNQAQSEAGFIAEEVYKKIKAQGRLAHGNYGLAEFSNLEPKVTEFADIVKLRTANPKVPAELFYANEKAVVCGKINNIYDTGLIQYRLASIKNKDRIRNWISLVAFCLSDSRFQQISEIASILLGSDKEGVQEEMYALKAGEAAGIMNTLIDYYLSGLQKPLKLFPEASYAFCKQIIAAKVEEMPAASASKAIEAAMEKADSAWVNEYNNIKQGDALNASIRYCFGKTMPRDNDFILTAISIFTPMIKAAVENGKKRK